MHDLMRKSSTIYVVAALLSVVLSCWLSMRESVINPDAICYLQSAADMKFGLSAGMHLCGQAKWPFYSVLIYGLHSITSFSFESAAYFLNGLFSLISVVAFIAILRIITDKPRILWLGVAVILLAHEFNSVRQYIIRDHGFWAFYLLSIYCLVRYFAHQTWRNALLWSASITIATLFRVEGAMFLLLIPFSAFFNMRNRFTANIKSFLQLNAITLTVIIALFVCIVLKFQVELSRLEEVRYQLSSGIATVIHHFGELKTSLAQHVLTHDSVHEASAILFLMMFSWYFYSVILNLSLIYTILVVYSWLKNAMRADGYVSLALWGYVIVNILITACFLTENMFLSKRYLIALSLVLMLWVPFALERLVTQSSVKKWPMVAALVLIVMSSLGGIFDFGYSKRYIIDAGNWLENNTPQNAVIYSNDFQLMYYTHRFGDSIFVKAHDYVKPQAITDGRWRQYEYLALRLNSNDVNSETNVSKDIQYKLVQVFSNKRGDQVRIYQRG